MTTATDNAITREYAEAITKTQEVFLNAAKEWAEIVRTTQDISLSDGIPSPVEFVERGFDQVEQVFALQRKLVQGVAQAYAPVVERAVTAWPLGLINGTGAVANPEATDAA
jgi:hypothetical protein